MKCFLSKKTLKPWKSTTNKFKNHGNDTFGITNYRPQNVNKSAIVKIWEGGSLKMPGAQKREGVSRN